METKWYERSTPQTVAAMIQIFSCFFLFHSNDIENYLRLNPLIPFFGLIQVSNSP